MPKGERFTPFPFFIVDAGTGVDRDGLIIQE
jgi:hypothetical protein